MHISFEKMLPSISASSSSLTITNETENQSAHDNSALSSSDPFLVSIRIITFGLLYGKISKSSYDLIYNLQDLPNPLTAQARKKMTGLNKPLR